MDGFRYTLVTDGSSDRALIPILNWLLIENGVVRPIQPAWADLRVFSLPDRTTLVDRIRLGLVYYPCDLLFVHRDAERESRESRVQEIDEAVACLPEEMSPKYVCVIPIRMQEAWLLVDEAAIKAAAGNKGYAGRLEMPVVSRLERLADPKSVLNDLLRQACDLNRRRQRSFRVAKHARLVTEFIDDFSPLRQLSAFAALEEEISNAIKEYKWYL